MNNNQLLVGQRQVNLDSTHHHNPISLQLHAGSQGLGIGLRYGLGPKATLRLGGSAIFPVHFDNAINFSGFDADNTLQAKLANVHLLADYMPFKTDAFKLVGGLAYMYQANGGLKFVPNGNYDFGGLKLTSEEVGRLNIDLSWQGIAPYVGFGLFKTFPNKLFNVNVDLGTYYLNAPKSTVVGTNLLADNNAMEPQLDQNMKGYRFLPVVQVNFNFRLR